VYKQNPETDKKPDKKAEKCKIIGFGRGEKGDFLM
jgi:hypothetical protein